jgi:hypothetical protein
VLIENLSELSRIAALEQEVEIFDKDKIEDDPFDYEFKGILLSATDSVLNTEKGVFERDKYIIQRF